MGRPSDLEAGGGRFDSRCAQVTFFGHVGRVFRGFLHMLGHVGGHFFGGVGALFGRVGVTFWSGRGRFFVKFGMSWDVSGSGLGRVWDGFGRVWGKMFEGVDE